MVRINLTEENLISTTGVADRRFADHSGDIQHGYQLGSLTEGLVAYYPMEKGQGRVLFDGATGNHGQIEGATWNGSGKVGDDSLSFDGSSYSDVGKNISTPMTISLWLKWSSLSVSFQAPFGFNDTGDSSSVAFFVDNQAQGSANPVFDDGTNRIAGSALDVSGGWGDNTWHHFVSVLYPTQNSVSAKMFVDGVEESSTTDASPNLDSISQTYTHYIGALNNDGSASDYFTGQIDDVRIYDRALSQPEIEALAGLTEPSGFLVEEQDVPTLREFERDLGGAVSRYEFENDVTDSWGENDGIDNTSAGFVDGVYGQAKDFDGSDDYVNIGDNPSLNPSTITISAWINTNTVSSRKQVVSKDADGARDYRLQINAGGENGSVTFYVYDSTGTPNSADTGADVISTGDWYHLTGTYNGSEILLYVNGEIVAQQSSSFEPNDTNTDLRIGSRVFSGFEEYFDGSMDDVRIYSRALDPIEVETLFNKGAYRIKRGNL